MMCFLKIWQKFSFGLIYGMTNIITNHWLYISYITSFTHRGTLTTIKEENQLR